MPDQSVAPRSDPPAGPQPPKRGWTQPFRDLLAFRRTIPLWQEVLLALLCVLLVFGLWWFVTRGEEAHERIVSPLTLPSPAETFASFPTLWYGETPLTRSTFASLERVALGFGLAALVGIPLGILCGCYARIHAFLMPPILFGRNIPIAALIPLMFSFFGTSELQKVMFIFIASVAFVVSDTARAVQDVGSHYIDTAYTLGASRRQVILKVLVPLALPSVFNSLRLLFGIAFGYIMLVESFKLAEDSGGLGNIINSAQRVKNVDAQGRIMLILLLIPLVALVIDRFLYWVQRELFPYRYGGVGMLNRMVRFVLHAWGDLKALAWKPSPEAALILSQLSTGKDAKP